MRNRPPVIFLMGPTAAGKTEFALMLAERFPCEIISVDSSQVYRGMDIGTAKPSLIQRRSYPHHLIDILDPVEAYSAGRFYTDAQNLMKAISDQGRIPLLVGGTMLYFHTLKYGMSSLPPANPEIRAAIAQEAMVKGWDTLYLHLANVDPVTAERISSHDPQRIQRALEVFQLTGKPLSELTANSQQPTLPYRVITLILAPKDRSLLHKRIERRFWAMLEAGFLEEVKQLFMRHDLSIELVSIRAVGYRQAWLYLQGQFSFDIMVERAISATRQMAKRQLTWLRRENNAIYIQSGEDLREKEIWGILDRVLV